MPAVLGLPLLTDLTELDTVRSLRGSATRADALRPRSGIRGQVHDVEDVAAVARTHGIGVVTAGNPEDYETWDELEEARRIQPDPEKLNDFIAAQLTDHPQPNLSTPTMTGHHGGDESSSRS
jgi:NAD(P)H-dependent flavin oxidoreductase YrpB (nitropropane dioxygenase family)